VPLQQGCWCADGGAAGRQAPRQFPCSRCGQRGCTRGPLIHVIWARSAAGCHACFRPLSVLTAVCVRWSRTRRRRRRRRLRPQVRRRRPSAGAVMQLPRGCDQVRVWLRHGVAWCVAWSTRGMLVMGGAVARHTPLSRDRRRCRRLAGAVVACRCPARQLAWTSPSAMTRPARSSTCVVPSRRVCATWTRCSTSSVRYGWLCFGWLPGRGHVLLVSMARHAAGLWSLQQSQRGTGSRGAQRLCASKVVGGCTRHCFRIADVCAVCGVRSARCVTACRRGRHFLHDHAHG
jgi:hypothetical protein